MIPSGKPRSVCIVGAGFISNVHLDALKRLSIPTSAVVDPNVQARQRLASNWQIPEQYASVEEALAHGNFDRAHVLVPPDLHQQVAAPLLRAGVSVLVEKPLATTSDACRSLIASAEYPARLGVNQNFVFHPSFAKLRGALSQRVLGMPRFANVIYHAPLRQLAARQFGHWMFREPRNILLEQAVHPLSQILALCGDVVRIDAIGDEPISLSPGVDIIPSFTSSILGKAMPASFRFAVGQDFPFWQVSVQCDDGVLIADMLGNRFWTMERTRWMEAVDNLISGHATAGLMIGASWRNFAGYVLSTLKLAERRDGFFQSMKRSIEEFHGAIDRQGSMLVDGAFGRRLVEICDSISAQIMPRASPIEAPLATQLENPDVAILGGTGFIGTALVRKLRSASLTVSVMARNSSNLPAVFYDAGVKVCRGDIRNPADISSAIRGARYVINLAHGGGGGSWEEIRAAMLGGAENVAAACLDAGVQRLIHVGSIASLYLGPQRGAITGSTPPDAQIDKRAYYSRAKILCDQRLLELHRSARLPVCILRPGLVVGEGTSPLHSGLGFFNNDQHCIGWNRGRNPLPFVLVDDVADALLHACTAKGVEGRSYNIVGDVRPNAREYISQLAKAKQRPLRYHPKSPYVLYFIELTKWTIKVVGGRKVDRPSLRDILSRGLRAAFDCSDTKIELGWTPIGDRTRFYERAF